MNRRLLLIALLCSPLLLTGGKPKVKPRLLRFPFGLTPAMSADDVKAALMQKSIAGGVEKQVGKEVFISWKLNNQIVYGDFAPDLMVAILEENKLKSVALVAPTMPTCGTAQPVFLSALSFVRDNYDKLEAPITMEPAVDALDCGPAFRSGVHELRRESKKFVCTLSPNKTPNGYDLSVTYYDRPRMKPVKEDNATPEKQKTSAATLENL